MNKQVKDPLDKLFESLNDVAYEGPSTQFVQDLESRLDLLAKKSKKPFVFWLFSISATILFGASLYALLNLEAKQHQLRSTAKQELKSAKAVSLQSSTITSSSSKSAVLPSLQLANELSNKLLSSSSKTEFPALLQGASSSAFTSISIPFSPNLINDNDSLSSPLLVGELVPQQAVLNTVEKQKDSVFSAPSLPLQPSNTKVRFSQQIGLQFGVSGIYSSFDVPTNNPLLTEAQLKQFRTERELGERQTSSWDFNLRYGLAIGNWHLQTGLHYFEWGEQLQYEVISVLGVNRYRYVNLPMLIGRSFELGKVQLIPYAGLSLGKCFSPQGTYIQPQLNGVNLVNAKQLAGSFIAQIELQYQLNSQLSVTCSPAYRRTIGALIDNGVVINKYQSLGLLTGFIYKF